MGPSILYWVQVNTGRQHSHSHPFFRKFSQFNRTLRQFSKKVSVQSKVGMLASRTLWRPYVGFIRSCHNPIGRAQPKNWNLWLCHIKQRSGKKVDKVLCWKYRDWWQSIRGMTREVLECLLLLYESKEGPKKGTRRPTKMAKNTKIVTKWSFMGRNGTSTIPKWSEKQDQQNPDRVIAPKPLKWGFKSDLMAANFSKIFAIFGPMDTK